jgi:hypothetical protein
MKEKQEIELDCTKKCKYVVSECESGGSTHDECRNRYNQCVSRCAFA